MPYSPSPEVSRRFENEIVLFNRLDQTIRAMSVDDVQLSLLEDLDRVTAALESWKRLGPVMQADEGERLRGRIRHALGMVDRRIAQINGSEAAYNQALEALSK